MTNRYNPSEPLISIHIPKSGGTSFAAVLKEWFGNKLHLNYYDERKNKLPVKLKWPPRSRDCCIHGHFNKLRGFGIDDYYPKSNQLITILRDPLDLHISRFNYRQLLFKHGQLYRNGAKEQRMNLDIDEFLETVDSTMLLHFPSTIDQHNYKKIINKRFLHIGVLEKLDSSIELISNIISKKNIELPQLNKSKAHSEPSNQSVRIFKEKNQLEYQIYNIGLTMNS